MQIDSSFLNLVQICTVFYKQFSHLSDPAILKLLKIQEELGGKEAQVGETAAVLSDLAQRRRNGVEKQGEGRSTGVRVEEERENCERGNGGRKGEWRCSYRLCRKAALG